MSEDPKKGKVARIAKMFGGQKKPKSIDRSQMPQTRERRQDHAISPEELAQQERDRKDDLFGQQLAMDGVQEDILMDDIVEDIEKSKKAPKGPSLDL